MCGDHEYHEVRLGVGEVGGMIVQGNAFLSDSRWKVRSSVQSSATQRFTATLGDHISINSGSRQPRFFWSVECDYRSWILAG